MLKKSIASVLLLSILLTTYAYALSGTDGHWAGQYASVLYDMGVFKGDDNGNANLADNIRRIEFLTLLVRAIYNESEIPEGTKSFIDVSSGSWYYDIASFAKQRGIVMGDDTGRLLPDSNIKREEIVLMLVRGLELKGDHAQFTDIDSTYIYYNEICAAVASGIIKGYTDGSFCPKNPATRGEAAAMISRMLGIEFDTDEPDYEQNEEETSEKINLTWHHISAPGITSSGEYMDGLNVVSPTWFRIRSFADEKPASYEYKLDGDNIYYLQDIGNKEYVEDAHKKGYKVWALFKSNDFSPRNNSGFLNDEAARKSAVALMRQMIDKYNLDGINMDFENMLVEDKDVYTQLVKEMSEMMKDTGAVLSVDVTKYSPMGGTWSMCYDRKKLAEYADYIALMAYDQHVATSTKAGSVADLKWAEDAILKTFDEVPAHKLILGIPFYARLWQSQNGRVIETSAIGMQTAQNRLAQEGVQAQYDEKTGQNYASWESGGTLFEIWLEDETSIKNRLELMKKYNLAGVASWSKQFADSQAWTAIKENLY